MIVLAGIITGLFLTSNPKEQSDTDIIELSLANTVEDECIDEEIALEDMVTASAQEIKVSPNSVLLVKKLYKECGHITKEYVEVPINLVNKGREDVQAAYSDWEIEHFSEKDITISKEFEGICNEHYVVKETNGNIAVYYLDSSEQENLLEVTEISTEYLPEEDLLSLREGIRVNGRGRA